MIDLNTYNYYLRQVLGVQSYVGQPQLSPATAGADQVLPDNTLNSKTLVVVEHKLSKSELDLLEKIMVAVGQSENYLVVTSDQFVGGQSQFKKYIFMKSKFFSNTGDFEVFTVESSAAVQGCRLKDMLPPSPPQSIQENKKLLWEALRKLFR